LFSLQSQRLPCLYLAASASHLTVQHKWTVARLENLPDFLYDNIPNRCLCFAATFESISIKYLWNVPQNIVTELLLYA
jgi:hypothetical protein